MPWNRMKRVMEYCTYNKAFFCLVLVLFGVLNYIMNLDSANIWTVYILSLICYIVISGYGMTITRDRINEGFRLPKIQIKDVLNLGLKASLVSIVYMLVQEHLLEFICNPMDFPLFDLEDMLLDLSETIHLFFTHNPIDTLIFIVVGAILFYITVFFMEIALARLADTGRLISAFNLLGIKEDIDLMGWRNYAKDYTLIVIAIVLFCYLKLLVIPVSELNFIWDTILDLFIFATQYLGIGAVYSQVKIKKSSVE